MKTLKIGIATYEDFKARTLAIAKGELKPNGDDPKIWFESLESMAQILSVKNRELLHVIRDKEPKSLTELAEMVSRDKGNLSRTLKTMQQHGLIDMRPSGEGKELMPIVPYELLKLDYDLFVSHPK